MKKICKRCYENAVRTGTLDAVKQLLKHGNYICPRLDVKCGNTARTIASDLTGLAKLADVFFNGRPA